MRGARPGDTSGGDGQESLPNRSVGSLDARRRLEALRDTWRDRSREVYELSERLDAAGDGANSHAARKEGRVVSEHADAIDEILAAKGRDEAVEPPCVPCCSSGESSYEDSGGRRRCNTCGHPAVLAALPAEPPPSLVGYPPNAILSCETPCPGCSRGFCFRYPLAALPAEPPPSLVETGDEFRVAAGTVVLLDARPVRILAHVRVEALAPARDAEPACRSKPNLQVDEQSAGGAGVPKIQQGDVLVYLAPDWRGNGEQSWVLHLHRREGGPEPPSLDNLEAIYRAPLWRRAAERPEKD